MPDLPPKPLFDAPDGTSPLQPMEPQMPDETPAVSPTGTPLLPPKAVPYAVAVVGAAALLVAAPELGLPFVIPMAIVGIAKIVVALGALLGIVSPGLRK
jgi:hypothetical protein